MQKIFSQEVRLKADDGSEYPKWETKRLGDIFKERNENAVGNELLLSVTISDGIIKQSETSKRNVSNEDKSAYKVVMPGDIAYNSMRMWQGAEGISPYKGIVSPAYTVLIPTGVCAEYFEYFFKMPEVMFAFQRYSVGLTSDTWNLRYKALAKLKFSMPCLAEQQKIANLFSSFDETLRVLKQKLSAYELLKKGLMQQMFV